MTVGSVRRGARSQLRVMRVAAGRRGAGEPPWPTGLRRLRHVLRRLPGAGVLLGLLGWVLRLGLVSIAAPRSAGIPGATTSFLGALWQVQAASVSLALALAVFVFGLLPQVR